MCLLSCATWDVHLGIEASLAAQLSYHTLAPAKGQFLQIQTGGDAVERIKTVHWTYGLFCAYISTRSDSIPI